MFSSIFGWEASVTSDPAPAWCQDVKLKEELDGLKKNIANGTRTLVDIILLSWEVLQISKPISSRVMPSFCVPTMPVESS